MRIASGVTDQYIQFYATDSTDNVTAKTGLSSFTVYRVRNGGTATAMTTPTVTEIDATNMPGWYKLLLDEDMTIGTGNITEAMGFHITATGMTPTPIEIELFDAAYFATAASLATAQTDLDTITGSDGVTLATAQANYAPATATALATAQADLDTITGTDGVTLATAQALYAPAKAGDSMALTAAAVDAVWDEAIAGHSGTAGSVAEQLAAAGAAGDPWATSLPGSYTAGQAGKIVGDNLNATVSSRMATTHINATAGAVDNVTLVATTTTNTDMRGTDSAALATALSTVSTNVSAILTDTGTTLPATLATLATSTALSTVGGNVSSILTDTGTTLPAQITALNNISVSDVLTTQLTESYAAKGTVPTLTQAILELRALQAEKSISSTTLTAKKIDGATTAGTYSLDDATTPTSITRAT